MNPSPANSAAERRRFWAEVALIFLATALAYAPVLKAGLIWNDSDYVTRPALRSLAGLARIWLQLGATEQYYPLLHSAFWVEHRLWGDAPLGYHLLNVALHAASASIVLLILRRLAVPGAWLAALVFALHPVCVESVAWISEQKNTLSTVFYLLSALAYLRFAASRRRGPYLLASGCFVLAVLSKTVTATLPAALLVLTWWRAGQLSWRRDVVPLLPWLLFGAAAGLASGWVERTYIGAQGSDFSLTGVERLLLAGRAVWFYAGKLLWPAKLIFIYPRWHISAASMAAYAGLAALGGVLAGLAALRRRTRAPLAAALYFVGTLFPTLGFFNVYAFVYSYVADHWQYLASLGLIVPGCAALAEAACHLPPLARRAGAAALLAVLAGLSFRQARMYNDMETFYRSTLAENPGAWMAWNNLGVLRRDAGDRAEAIADFEAAGRVEPGGAEIHNNLGVSLADAGRFDEARREYDQALRLRPRYAMALNNLAFLLYRTGRLPEALATYDRALELNPRHPAAHFNRGRILADLGRMSEAEEEYEAARRLDPQLPGTGAALAAAHNEQGRSLAAAGQTAAAVREYREALRWEPDLPEAHNNLGSALTALGERAAAQAELREALRLRPQYPEADYNLGLALATAGRNQEALAAYAEAVRLKPDYAEAESNWGAALATLGRPQEAIGHYERALRLDPGYRAAHFNLGLALRAVGREDEARAEFAAAERLAPRR